MQLRLNDLSLQPPEPVGGFVHRDGRRAKRTGHWWFYSEQTDSWLFAGCYRELVEALRLHLVANLLPVPADLDGCVQEGICQMTPHNWRNGCVATDPAGFSLSVTLAHVKRWLRTMAAYAADGTLVSQEEAEERAQTCLRCRYRVPITGCAGCGTSLGGLITKLAINRSTPYDADLTACGVCGCAQKAMIHFDNESLDRGAAGLEYPADTDGRGTKCWRRDDA